MENTMTNYITALFSELIVIDPRRYARPYPFDELLEHCDVDLVIFVYPDHNVSQEFRQFLNHRKNPVKSSSFLRDFYV